MNKQQAADCMLQWSIVLLTAVFILYPIFSVVRMSLIDQGELTLRFYRAVMTKDSLKLIHNSLRIALLSSTLTTAFSLMIALYLFLSGERARRMIRSLLMLTMISPPFVGSLAFIMLFGRRGLITYGLLGLSLNPYGWQGIVILQTVSHISFAAILLYDSFERVDTAQVLASRDLGANMLQTIVRIVLPAVYPGLLSAFFILFTMNLADFGTPIIIGGRYRVLATEAYLLMLSSSSLGQPAAMSMLLLPPALIAFYFYRRNMEKQENAAQGNKLVRHERMLQDSPRWLRLILIFVTGLYFTIMVLQYGNILLSTVANTATGSLQFTTKNIRELKPGTFRTLRRSIQYSLAAGVMGALVGTLLSYYTHRLKRRGMKMIEFAASLPYIIPGTFFGLGYVAAFSRPPLLLRGTAWILILNFAFRQISVSNKLANAQFQAIDDKIDLAARDLGASQLQVLGGIVLPMLRPTLLTGFITTFTASMTAVGAVVFLISPGKNVSSVMMFQSIESGKYGAAAVQGVILIAVTVTVNLIALYLGRRMERANERDFRAKSVGGR